MNGKGTKKVKLSLANKAILAGKTLKNARSAFHRRHVSPSGHLVFQSYRNRVASATRKAKEKANKNAENHIKLDKSLGALRVINNKLINALKIYDEKLDKGEVSDDMIDSVSFFLLSIQDALSEGNLDLNINDDENPADYVERLTRYIKRNLIHNYDKGNTGKKVKEAVFILNVFRDSVKEHEEAAKELDLADVEME
jgi:hypothetical protein